jgi:hypothetical protein
MSEDGNSRIGDGEQENVAGSGNSSTDRELTDSHTVLCQKKGAVLCIALAYSDHTLCFRIVRE